MKYCENYMKTIAKKLTLCINFTNAVLHSRENAIEICLTNPKTVVAMLACKLCIVNARANAEINKIKRTCDEVERKRNKD